MIGTSTAFLCFGLTLGLRNLVHSRILPKPIIRAEPGSLVAKGTQVTVSCEGTSGAQDYYLYRHGNPHGFWNRMTLMMPGNKAKFLIPFVKWSHAGQYLCIYQKHPNWSEKSDTLELVVTGFFRKPNLSTLTSPVVTSGGNMTLQCVSSERYDSFILTKNDEKFFRPLDSQYIQSTGQFQALFHMGPVTTSHRGMFRCYGYKNSSYMWSEPSDPLEIYISGQHLVKPFLSAHPGPSVYSGENVTLLCQSWHQMDTFLLFKEETTQPLLNLRSLLQDGLYQANFSMRNVTFGHGGTYKCYSSQFLFPYSLSNPSNLVELVVSGYPEDHNSSSQESIPVSELEKYLKILIWISVVFLLLLFLLTLLFLQCKHQDKLREKAQRESTSLKLLAEAVEPVTMASGPQKR